MGARCRVNSGTRRPARDRGLGGASGGGFGPTPPLDATVLEYWDAEQGIVTVGGAVDTWTGQKAGIVLTAPSPATRPNYITDAFFNGTAVVQSTAAGRYIINSALGTPIVLAGARPYTLSLVRQPSVIPGASLWGALGLGGVGNENRHYVSYQTFGGSQLRPVYNNAATVVAATAVADTSVRVIEFWPDGTNLNCRDNSALFSTLSATSVGANCTRIGVGASDLGTNVGGFNHAFHIICSSKPSEAFITLLRAWLTARKGAP